MGLYSSSKPVAITCNWLVIWCRRRDSNSQSFRHYHLKIACLPISPRRLLLSYVQITQTTYVILQSGHPVFYPENSFFLSLQKANSICYQFAGICAAPVAGTAGTTVTGAAGAVTPSRTLPELTVGRAMPKYASKSVDTKNTVAKTAVVRDKKLALPVAPKRLPDPPLPKAAPMSAPLPC